MKKIMYAAMFLLSLGMMVSCGGSGRGKTEENETTNSETQVSPAQEAPVQEEAQPADDRPRVYACAYDGYVNIRETPNGKAPIVGVFRNGPDGAFPMGIEGEWTWIEYNGITGYVLSKYVQITPTIAYTGTATIDDIAGLYYSPSGYGMYLWEDGTWESGYDDPVEGGNYILQNNEVNLAPGTRVDKYILPIDLAHHKLGEWERQPFITQKEIDQWMKENRDYLSYEIEQNGEKWFKDHAIDFMREGSGSFYPMTKAEFKKKR